MNESNPASGGGFGRPPTARILPPIDVGATPRPPGRNLEVFDTRSGRVLTALDLNTLTRPRNGRVVRPGNNGIRGARRAMERRARNAYHREGMALAAAFAKAERVDAERREGERR
jgi:hypothetical protein